MNTIYKSVIFKKKFLTLSAGEYKQIIFISELSFSFL